MPIDTWSEGKRKKEKFKSAVDFLGVANLPIKSEKKITPT